MNQKVDIKNFKKYLDEIDELTFRFCDVSLDNIKILFKAIENRRKPVYISSLSRKNCVLKLTKRL